MYISIAIVAYLVLAIVGIFDKFIVDKSVPNPTVLTFYSTIFLLPLFLLAPLGTALPYTWFDWGACLISGFAFSMALWSSYRGLQSSEVSHLGPLIGAATPFFVFWLSWWLLDEQLSSRQLQAIALLILGSVIISFQKSKDHHSWNAGLPWGILAGLLFAISHIASKYIYAEYGFVSGLSLTRGFMGVFGLLLLLSPAVKSLWHQRPASHGHSVGKQILLVGANKILGTVGVLLEQYAIAIGSVTVVNALVGVQYGCLILLVMLLSFFWPRLFREDYSFGEVLQEIVAVVVIMFGLVMLVR